MYVFNGLNNGLNKFLMFQFKVVAIFHQVCEYFHSLLKISHEFCVFDLDQSVLFFIPNYFVGNV